MKTLTDRKLITCLLPKTDSKAFEVAKMLHDEKGIETANVSSGRGTGMVKSISYGVWGEVDILTVIVSEQQAEEIFNFIYEKADINRPHGGFIYQGVLAHTTPFLLPDLPEED